MTATDITARHCAEVLRAGERRVFGMLAAGAPLDGLMSELCEAVGQALRREAYVGLLLLDGGRLMPLADRGVPAPLRQATATAR